MLLEIKNELKKKRKGMSNIGKEANLAMEEKRLVQQITAQTKEKNENNVTRTAAYLDFYKRHPEIHWAFLGHMVSRNGGWNMTDLKGELLLYLLTEKEQQSFFTFLERGNWLIFQDIYPQFLLYEESKNEENRCFIFFQCFTYQPSWKRFGTIFGTTAILLFSPSPWSLTNKIIWKNALFKIPFFKKASSIQSSSNCKIFLASIIFCFRIRTDKERRFSSVKRSISSIRCMNGFY